MFLKKCYFVLFITDLGDQMTFNVWIFVKREEGKGFYIRM